MGLIWALSALYETQTSTTATYEAFDLITMRKDKVPPRRGQGGTLSEMYRARWSKRDEGEATPQAAGAWQSRLYEEA